MKTKHKRQSTSSAEPEHNDSPRRSPGHSRSRTSRSSSPRQRKRSFSRSVSTSPRRARSRSRSDSPHNGYENGRRNRSKSPMSNRRRHLGSRDNPNPSRCLGVFGLSIYTSERQITSIFSKFGPLEKVQVVLDAKTQKSRGFAFVYFESMKDSTEAKNECSGMEVDGRRIRVDYSITQRPHTPTPGIYMGKPESLPPSRSGGGSNRSYGRGGGDGHYRDRYNSRHRRSPSPYYHRQRSSRRDYHDRSYDRSYDRYDKSSHYDRYDRYDRGYDRYDKYDRSRSRSYSPSSRRYKY